MSQNIQPSIVNFNNSYIQQLSVPCGTNLANNIDRSIQPYIATLGYDLGVPSNLWVGDGNNWNQLINNTGSIGPIGNTGPTGVAGHASTTGATGNIGYTGNTGLGATGLGATGQSGSSGSTGNSGQTGQTGLGATGQSGSSGSTGNSGATGQSGSSGSTGNSGQTGQPGSATNTGSTGHTGVTGQPGSATNTGATGNTGQTGKNGATGQPGSATTTGSTGGATGQTGKNGATGQPGSASNTGSSGPTGMTGSTGQPGSATNTGSSGPTGGATGQTGNTGQPGSSTNTGSTGQTGNTGYTGTTGQTGQPGSASNTGATGNATGQTGQTGQPGFATSTGSTGLTGTLSSGIGSFQYLSGNNNTFYTSSYRYIVGQTFMGSNSQYLTISSAITQAVADGASNTTPAFIFITEGVYTENITLSDGIYIVGQETYSSVFGTIIGPLPLDQRLPVVLNGNIIITQTSTTNSINCGLSNIQLLLDTSSNNTFQINSNSGGAAARIGLILNNIFWFFSFNNIFLYNATDNSGAVTISVGGGQLTYRANNNQQFFNMGSGLTANHILNVFSNNTDYNGIGIINNINFGTLNFTTKYGSVNNFLFSHTSTGSFTWFFAYVTANNTTLNQPLITSNSSSIVTISFTYSAMPSFNTAPIGTIASIDLTNNTNIGSSIVIQDCIFNNTSSTTCNYFCPALNNSSQSCRIQNCEFANSNINNIAYQDMTIINGIRNILYKMTGQIQTLNASQTILTFQVLPIGVTYIEANVYGINSTNNDFYSAKLICSLMWDGTTATLGLISSLGQTTTSTASATITNSNNTIQVSVTGLTGTTYNWSCNLILDIKN